ncbi:MAG: hypothetical protein JST54_34840 [Deltaproteobacteria bacterium]|nr:hypothetical protein [Deltaproteobacteria bacterium]
MIRPSPILACCFTALATLAAVEGTSVARPHPADPAPAPRHVGMKRYRGGFNQDSSPICQAPRLRYYGGPIIQSPVIVPVFWGSHVNAQLTNPTTGMAQFFADVTRSSYWSWLHEYDTAAISSGTNQAVLGGTATAGITITPAHCASTGTCTLADAQIQTELANQIDAGVLPAPTLDCSGNTQTIYMIEFPPNVKVSGPSGTGNSCVAFCAYHGTGTYNGNPLLYAVLMDEFTGPCAQGCGGDATAMENSTDTASHELVEAVTDPDIGLVPGTANMAAPGGWYDSSNGCGEVADICADGSPGATITVNGRSWVVQQVWSNKQNKCASSGAVPAVCSGSATTSCRRCTCGDDGNACSAGCDLTSGVCESSSTSGSDSGTTSGSSSSSGSTTEGTAGSSGGSSGHSATGSTGSATGTAQGGSTSGSKGTESGGCGCGTSGSDPFAVFGLVVGLGLLCRRRATTQLR